jgi:hypothetical protein
VVASPVDISLSQLCARCHSNDPSGYVAGDGRVQLRAFSFIRMKTRSFSLYNRLVSPAVRHRIIAKLKLKNKLYIQRKSRGVRVTIVGVEKKKESYIF